MTNIWGCAGKLQSTVRNMGISSVADVLFEKFAKLYHAANLLDFQTYCDRKALLARSVLTGKSDAFTPFYSDTSDKQRGVWERVFGNLQDFNSLFWAADGCVPNAYGPITLVFTRAVWRTTEDIAVTRENAAAKDYSLAACRMGADAVASCFEKFDDRWWRLKCDGLEVSLGTSSTPFDHIDQIIVDPVAPDFVARVRQSFEATGYDGNKVVPRTVGKHGLRADRLKIFEELVEWSRRLRGNVPNAQNLRSNIPVGLKTWTDNLHEPLWGPLRQWLEYIYVGTLNV